MTKNIRLFFILSWIFSAVVIAWNTLANFFGGVGLNYVALLMLLASMLVLSVLDNQTAKRTKDLFIICCVLTILELLVYFVFEYNIGGFKTKHVFWVFQNIYAFIGILLVGYSCFRFIYEVKNQRFKFIEVILGQEKVEKKQKKAKELSNGSLLDKPNRTAFEEQVERDDFVEQPEETIQDTDKSDNAED